MTTTTLPPSLDGGIVDWQTAGGAIVISRA